MHCKPTKSACLPLFSVYPQLAVLCTSSASITGLFGRSTVISRCAGLCFIFKSDLHFRFVLAQQQHVPPSIDTGGGGTIELISPAEQSVLTLRSTVYCRYILPRLEIFSYLQFAMLHILAASLLHEDN